ncbi:1,4-alpha-glucan branching protein GlgB, partial [Myxococcota bacterium]
CVDKTDPFALFCEVPPKTASIVWDLCYEWGDKGWMRDRRHRNSLEAPMSVYEVHLGSWRRVPEDGNRSLSYRELANQLVEYVSYMGYTHVEFLPVNEHPLYPSWGYLVTGYFAPTSRYGTPQDLMYLVDCLHRAGIGVIIDWVPAHFPSDEHGLGYFDGTHLFEHSDSRQGRHPDWGSLIFNYGRHEVRSFLTSSAIFWLDRYHIDGLRIDGVASMLYLDYARQDGEWIPNRYGGKENLEAISLLRHLNGTVYVNHGDVQTFAEESTDWPRVSHPNHAEGLGFGFKWDMGWAHDILRYLTRDPIHRKYHHTELTFRGFYAFAENFCMPLSHDDVVHGKGSLSRKMAGDDWQKFANLRLLFSYMFSLSGKKLMFMGNEIGQWSEWNHDSSVDWHLTDDYGGPHRGVMNLVRDLNRVYRTFPAMHRWDTDYRGFTWVDPNNADAGVLSFMRHAADGSTMLVVLNFTPRVWGGYRIGVDRPGWWKEMFNSDASVYGGSGVGNGGGSEAHWVSCNEQPASLQLTIPPLGALFLEAPYR